MNTLGIKQSWVFSAAFLSAAVIGFIPNPLVGSDGLFITNAPHNLVHLVTAIGFVIVARMGNLPSINYMLGFGVVYLLVGMIGFLVTGIGSEGMLLRFIHINALDNFLHLGLGTAILASGLVAKASIDVSGEMITKVSPHASQ